MEKTEDYFGPPPSFNEYQDEEERLKAEDKVPGHHDFNKRVRLVFVCFPVLFR